MQKSPGCTVPPQGVLRVRTHGGCSRVPLPALLLCRLRCLTCPCPRLNKRKPEATTQQRCSAAPASTIQQTTFCSCSCSTRRMASRNGREALRGVEANTFDLIFEVLTSKQRAEWLKFPQEVAAARKGNRDLAQLLGAAIAHIRDALNGNTRADAQVDPMTNKSGREALRGAEGHMLDIISGMLTSEQWAEWLQAPLERAAAEGNRDLAQKLVGAGAEIGDALHEAVRGGHGEVVRVLLESGASTAAKDKNGDNPLHIAARQGETEMVHLLLLKGADKDVFGNDEWTPLYLAAYEGHAAVALALLAAGADVNLRCGGNFKAAVMHVAAEMGHVEILRAVIEHGADLEAVDSDQETALHKAAVNNHVKAIDVLVEAGANIEARGPGGYTPLHSASSGLHRGSLLSLLKHGATVNAQANILGTPLICATRDAGRQGATEVVHALLRAGADETIVDDLGRNAADLIAEEVEEEDRLTEDVERVRELLANAPADRVWRRRGYLVLCRAHPDRVEQHEVASDTRHTDTGRRTRSRAKLATAEGVAKDSTADESTGGGWAVVVAKVLVLQEEGIFRTIVGYL